MSTASFLNETEERVLLRIARAALEEYLRFGLTGDWNHPDLSPRLHEQHGCFVTLHTRDGELRGCIGHILARFPLAQSVRDNAISAATRDPRFPSLRYEELPYTVIEISALCPGATPDSPFIPVNDISEIEIGRDGVYLTSPGLPGGLLLPQVAIERGWNSRKFVAAVCEKAGGDLSTLTVPGAQLYRFSAHIFSEPE